ncbi:MAG: putative peptidyl-prolyl cis-trans isomerase [bacterium ADurb.Bin243]|nr:MAG: putative peptidyl-prolyl cis-trans isomerase [bacterium ADurb.Bin243]
MKIYGIIAFVLIFAIAPFFKISPAFAEEKKGTSEVVIDEKALPQAKITTKYGDMVLELLEDETPNTVANFVSLIEKGFYDGLKFHRVVPDFVIQGGDPTGTGAGGPGYRIKCETELNKTKHTRGVLSMAHAGKDTGGSQFFITHRATPHLDGRHTVFGRVISGVEIVDKVQQGDTMDKVVMIKKRSHKYEPEKMKE